MENIAVASLWPQRILAEVNKIKMRKIVLGKTGVTLTSKENTAGCRPGEKTVQKL